MNESNIPEFVLTPEEVMEIKNKVKGGGMFFNIIDFSKELVRQNVIKYNQLSNNQLDRND